MKHLDLFSGIGGFALAAQSAVPEYVGEDDGLPGRVDRLAALGNAIEPDIAEAFFRGIQAVTQ